MSADPSFLFVYGTLKRGGTTQFARLLHRRAAFAGEATIAGRLYHLGQFPGAVAGEGRIAGELFRLPREQQALLSQLDHYEGCHPSMPAPHLFRREIGEALTAGGQPIPAWIYYYCAPLAGRPVIAIASGSYPITGNRSAKPQPGQVTVPHGLQRVSYRCRDRQRGRSD